MSFARQPADRKTEGQYHISCVRLKNIWFLNPKVQEYFEAQAFPYYLPKQLIYISLQPFSDQDRG
jgi:hypothetical protein